MNIKGVSTSNAINVYSKNTVNKVDKTSEVIKKDRIEISELAKSLNSYDVSGVVVNNDAKIEVLRNSIKNGTYSIDAKLTSESIMKAIKEGRE